MQPSYNPIGPQTWYNDEQKRPDDSYYLSGQCFNVILDFVAATDNSVSQTHPIYIFLSSSVHSWRMQVAK